MRLFFYSGTTQKIIMFVLCCMGCWTSRALHASVKEVKSRYYFIAGTPGIANHLTERGQNTSTQRLQGEGEAPFFMCQKGLVVDCYAQATNIVQHMSTNFCCDEVPKSLHIYLFVKLDEDEKRAAMLQDTIRLLDGHAQVGGFLRNFKTTKLHFIVIDPEFKQVETSQENLYEYLDRIGIADSQLVTDATDLDSQFDLMTKYPVFSDGVCIFNPQRLGAVWDDMGVSLDASSAFSSEGQQGSLFESRAASAPRNMQAPSVRRNIIWVEGCLIGLFLAILRQLVSLYTFNFKLMSWTITA